MKKLAYSLFTILVCMVFLDSNIPAYGQHDIRTRYGSIKPVLGWSSWSFIRREPTAAKLMAQAEALVKSGLAKFGYRYINLDDFWYLGVDSTKSRKLFGPEVGPYGLWVTDPSRFPPHGDTDGIKVVADYVHSLGLKFGIYLTPGVSKLAVFKKTPIKGTPFTADQITEPSVKEANYNFGGMVRINYDKPGAQEYIDSWADMFAGWGVDFIKLDGITNANTGDIKAWSRAIQQSGRSMVLDITQGSYTQAIAPILMKYADQWEFAPDIECYSCDEKSGRSFPLTKWENIESRFLYATVWQPYSVQGGYNDYDAIEVGNGSNTGLTVDERKAQLSLWALASAPLIIGADLTHLEPEDLKLLENTSVLAVDQDGIAAERFLIPFSNQPVFAKIEPNGDAIVGLFNIGDQAEEISIEASAIGISQNERGYLLDNLWTGEMNKTDGSISAVVPSHGVVLYRVRAR